MIGSFKHKGLKDLYQKGRRSGVNANWVDKVERMLARLDVSTSPKDMDIREWKLHELSGARKGTWAVWVTKNQRLTFSFSEGVASAVNIEDYHGK